MNLNFIKSVVVPAILLVAAAMATAGSIDDFEAREPLIDGRYQPYRLYIPRNYDRNHSYPLILSLHGNGGGGLDNVAQMNAGQLNIEDAVAGTQYDCFIVAPQIVSAPNWSSGDTWSRALAVLDMVRREFNVDERRMCVTGASMGGNGAWWAGDYYGNYFASVVPAGGWYSTNRASSYVSKPLWVFHGGADSTVSPSSDRAMIAAIRALGGNPLYTEYPGAPHYIWPQVYSEPALYPWIFAQVLPTAPPRVPGPLLAYDKVALGGGLCRYTFWIDNDDGLQAGYALTLGFEGIDGATIQQVKYYDIVPVDSSAAAAAWNGTGTPTYNMEDDSWFDEPFASNPRADINPVDGSILQGVAAGANSYCIAATSGTSTSLGTGVPVAQIVATGAVSWNGSIIRSGVKLYVHGKTGSMPGDFNWDGRVDQADYTAWADHFGMDDRAVLAPGSSNGDGIVDQADYTTWADNFGATVPVTVSQPAER